MIAESTPLGLDVNPDVTAGNVWEGWFTPVLEFIVLHNVRLWSYINADWDAQSMWAGEGWGDSRVQQSSTLAAQWHCEILQTEYFGGSAPCLEMASVGTTSSDDPTITIVCICALFIVFVGTLSLKALWRTDASDGRPLNISFISQEFPLFKRLNYGTVRPQELPDQ
jgi:hypothetical protein